MLRPSNHNLRLPTDNENSSFFARLGKGLQFGTGGSVREDWRAIIALLLVILVFALYSPATRFQFLQYDDRIYVTENEHVLKGLSVSSVKWAFSSVYYFYHPVTWLSLMSDSEIYGPKAAGFHLTNLLIHCCNVVLLFTALQRMTGNMWKSAFVAGLFACHPINVESVAWISERKGLLAGLFFMLSLHCYCSYTTRPSLLRYLLTMAAFVAGLLSKPSLVVLPALLMVLDYWPLRRYEVARSAGDAPAPTNRRFLKFAVLCAEKIPLLACGAFITILTVVAEREAGALGASADFPLPMRLENSFVCLALYLQKLVWPLDLSAFYPHPGWWPAGAVVRSAAVLGTVCLLFCVVWRRKGAACCCGFAWLILLLIPCLGVVQVGLHCMADRYAYLPMVGLGIAASFGTPWERIGRLPRCVLILGLLCCLGAFSGLSRRQLWTWRSDIDVFQNALVKNPNNWVAHDNLGAGYDQSGSTGLAEYHFRQAISVGPRATHPLLNLGRLLVRERRYSEAAEAYKLCLQRAWNDQVALYLAWMRSTSPDPQVHSAAHALDLLASLRVARNADPFYWDVLGAAQARAGDFAAAKQSALKAENLAQASAMPILVANVQKRIALYQEGCCFQEPAQPPLEPLGNAL
jgi:hypothetical protein